MSWQAFGAVQMHSRFRHDADDFTAYKLMLALAWFADTNGVIGVEGDHRKCPGYRTLAKRAAIHHNTVTNIMPKLYKSGELSIVADGGRGGGRWTVRKINLPMAGDDDFDRAVTTIETAVTPEIVRKIAATVADELVARGVVTTSENDVTTDDDTLSQASPQPPPNVVTMNSGNVTTAPMRVVTDQSQPKPLTVNNDQGGSTLDDFAQTCWSETLTILQKWRERLTLSRKFDDRDADDRADFIEPVFLLVRDMNGDGGAVWEMIVAKHQAMINDGLTPVRLAPIIAQIRSDQLSRVASAQQPANHITQTAANYAAMRAQLRRRLNQ